MLTFIETKVFTRIVGQRRARFRGVRKLRWALPGRGTRGGVRVIYFLRLAQRQVWMLTLYAKNEADSIPSAVLKKIRRELDGEA